MPAFGETACYHMQPYGDPRLKVYAQPVVAKKESDGTVPVHAGEYFGDTASYGGYGGESGVTLPADNIHSKLTREDYSAIGERFLAPDAEFVFLSYAECCFLKAEARLKGWGESSGKTARSYYEDGIRGSMAHYGIDAAEVEAYLNTPGIAWGTATRTTDDNGVDISTQFIAHRNILLGKTTLPTPVAPQPVILIIADTLFQQSGICQCNLSLLRCRRIFGN